MSRFTFPDSHGDLLGRITTSSRSSIRRPARAHASAARSKSWDGSSRSSTTSSASASVSIRATSSPRDTSSATATITNGPSTRSRRMSVSKTSAPFISTIRRSRSDHAWTGSAHRRRRDRPRRVSFSVERRALPRHPEVVGDAKGGRARVGSQEFDAAPVAGELIDFAAL